MAKASVKNAARMNLREGLDSEIDLFALCFSSEDKEEGVRAFIEKRTPVFGAAVTAAEGRGGRTFE